MSHSIKPQSHELEEAERAVEEAIRASKAVADNGKNLEVELGWTGDIYVVEKLGGVKGLTHSPKRIELRFNTEAENWKETLKAATANEYAHTIFFEEHGEDIVFNWQEVLFEAHSQHFSEKVFPDIEASWRKKYSEKDLSENWELLKEVLNEEIDLQRSLIYGRGSLPDLIGYSLAYRIGEHLLENHELEELISLRRSDVLEAGEELFR